MPRHLWTTPAAIVLSPMLLVAGDPLVRRWAGQARRCTTMVSTGSGRVLTGSGRPTRRSAFATDPLVTALTAPSRWAGNRLRRRRRDLSVAGFGWWPPPDAEGVRELARPKPGPPAGTIALREPPVE